MDPRDDLLSYIKKLEQRIETLEKQVIVNLTVPSDGKFVVRVSASDPSAPTNGEVWYNSSSHELKVYKNGSTRTITTS